MRNDQRDRWRWWGLFGALWLRVTWVPLVWSRALVVAAGKRIPSGYMASASERVERVRIGSCRLSSLPCRLRDQERGEH